MKTEEQEWMVCKWCLYGAWIRGVLVLLLYYCSIPTIFFFLKVLWLLMGRRIVQFDIVEN